MQHTKSGRAAPQTLKLLLSTVNFLSRYTQAMGILLRLSRWMGKPDHMTHIVAGNTAPGFSLKPLDNKEYSLNTLLERGPAQDTELQRTMVVPAITYRLSSLRCLPLTKQNP